MWPISLIKLHKKTQNCNKFDKKQRKNTISSKKTAKKEEMENVWQKIL